MVNTTDPKHLLRSSDDVTSPITVSVGRDGRVHLDLSMSPEGYEMLGELASRSGQRLDQIFTKAFLLYKAAFEATAEGKAVGVAPTAEPLETEFVGL